MTRVKGKQKKTHQRTRTGRGSLLDAPWRVYSAQEAAFLTGTSVRTLQRFRGSGCGPDFVKLTEKSIGYTAEALQRWVKSRTKAINSSGKKGVSL